MSADITPTEGLPLPTEQCRVPRPGDPSLRCVRFKAHTGDHGHAGIFWRNESSTGRASDITTHEDQGRCLQAHPTLPGVRCNRPPGHEQEGDPRHSHDLSYHCDGRFGHVGIKWPVAAPDQPTVQEKQEALALGRIRHLVTRLERDGHITSAMAEGLRAELGGKPSDVERRSWVRTITPWPVYKHLPRWVKYRVHRSERSAS